VFGDRHRFLAPSEGPVTAVGSWRAMAEDKGRVLPQLKAYRIVSDLDRNGSRGDLIALAKIATGLDPYPARSIKNGVLLAEIRFAFDRGHLLLLEGWEFGEHDVRLEASDLDDGTPEEKLARLVMANRREIVFEGRRYRFVAARGWRREAPSGDFRAVATAEASEIVGRMLARSNHGLQLDRKLPEETAEELSDSVEKAALLLLRHRPSGGASVQSTGEAAVTPSKLREKIAETAWIEIEIVYEDGTPFERNCGVELSDGKKTEGPPGKDGIVRMDGLDPGTCKVSFPDLDAASWDRA
jgi:hypothetical protein